MKYYFNVSRSTLCRTLGKRSLPADADHQQSRFSGQQKDHQKVVFQAAAAAAAVECRHYDEINGRT
jgi:hypothetical protein